MKKIIAILLALSIVFTIPCMAFAASEPYILPQPPCTIRMMLAYMTVFPVIVPFILLENVFAILGSPKPFIISETIFNFSFDIWSQIPLPDHFDDQLLV